MKTSGFDYDLPQERIAVYPPEERGSTRLEVLDRTAREIGHARYRDLGSYLRTGDLLVLNNSQVVQARMHARKTTGGRVELVLLEKHEGVQNRVMYRGRLKDGDVLHAHGHELHVQRVEGDGVALLELPEGGTLAGFFARYGETPIPPYLQRSAEEVDRERYQTVFAEIPGSVAAPTASLNMTPELLASLQQNGVKTAYVTLHVGLGTFMPIRVEDLSSHVMHREYYEIPVDTLEAIRAAKQNGGRVVAVGTTVTRALEHAAAGVLDPAENACIEGEADIFIYPGYAFRVIDALLTNFHAPRSTVLMLTAAFAGRELLQEAYREALERDYRFLSYGDSMLIV
ncbi:tRNA preQ1(34) S-adenosylmethionine ribosyltransferase-isomerase QueA [Prosthecochloris sp. N3]|uniref:S-adenosylmethionine:tRNA ribosyltransferase-isomerase n=1 Tax=Prosthecochloris ethylica TaxID=2743976 RepID=A0ABR9XUH6_9CHLB|nr:tRNA preQ1(34) S-adenosylmethionine ribosyltransferase-isomerase QueA [Prosthecochloris ethylica]MBF0587013.1 tRNA preQ1(34) S-adenosylmethionine ribosyltransferase-isomerase QueA [Prosthecochloris ethylica]MBF0637391.1 tRNA preQ1(34) S-adenosylmethionine ribosyltransferase-isomerase QueA [Prosthecochloris ethylica]NUK48147.1 tRNA preQ1(34) S-adenosylmethionine ribosyltransferase-isomerase QueA [Prosthecochloris ethylica]